MLVHLSLLELAPPDGQRRICWVLELCSCHACARHARLLTDHRREAAFGKEAIANVLRATGENRFAQELKGMRRKIRSVFRLVHKPK